MNLFAEGHKNNPTGKSAPKIVPFEERIAVFKDEVKEASEEELEEMMTPQPLDDRGHAARLELMKRRGEKVQLPERLVRG